VEYQHRDETTCEVVFRRDASECPRLGEELDQQVRLQKTPEAAAEIMAIYSAMSRCAILTWASNKKAWF
jgi:hypothetical protein